jgi:hypothetical protein
VSLLKENAQAGRHPSARIRLKDVVAIWIQLPQASARRPIRTTAHRDHDASASFEFSSTEKDSTFKCKLDNGVDNLPTLNIVKVGSAIPVKLCLGGNFGLNIFEAGYPKSVLISCESGARSTHASPVGGCQPASTQ